MSDFGLKLWAWLAYMDVSANELGRRMGGREGAVRKWFTAPRGPYAETMDAIASALGLTLGELNSWPPGWTRERAEADREESLLRTAHRRGRDRPTSARDDDGEGLARGRRAG